MDVWSIYVLKSNVDGRLYVGMAKDIANREKEHNAGKTKSTKGYRPWRLIYTEEIGDRQAARDKEKYYKTGSGKEKLKKLLNL